MIFNSLPLDCCLLRDLDCNLIVPSLFLVPRSADGHCDSFSQCRVSPCSLHPPVPLSASSCVAVRIYSTRCLFFLGSRSLCSPRRLLAPPARVHLGPTCTVHGLIVRTRGMATANLSTIAMLRSAQVYASPEIFQTDLYSYHVDACGIGIVTYMILHGEQRPLFQQSRESPRLCVPVSSNAAGIRRATLGLEMESHYTDVIVAAVLPRSSNPIRSSPSSAAPASFLVSA